MSLRRKAVWMEKKEEVEFVSRSSEEDFDNARGDFL